MDRLHLAEQLDSCSRRTSNLPPSRPSNLRKWRPSLRDHSGRFGRPGSFRSSASFHCHRDRCAPDARARGHRFGSRLLNPRAKSPRVELSFRCYSRVISGNVDSFGWCMIEELDEDVSHARPPETVSTSPCPLEGAYQRLISQSFPALNSPGGSGESLKRHKRGGGQPH